MSAHALHARPARRRLSMTVLAKIVSDWKANVRELRVLLAFCFYLFAFVFTFSCFSLFASHFSLLALRFSLLASRF